MTYANPFLADFQGIFFEILRIKEINPAKIKLIVLDEEPEERRIFERADVKDVLYQLGPKLNDMTIYTDRPEYFFEYVQKMDEENGLLVSLLPKGKHFSCESNEYVLILDFEWRGDCKIVGLERNCGYLPIHKKPWKVAENLDILVPFGYNTVIVKSKYTKDKKFVNDRFEEGFYRDELFYKEG